MSRTNPEAASRYEVALDFASREAWSAAVDCLREAIEIEPSPEYDDAGILGG